MFDRQRIRWEKPCNEQKNSAGRWYSKLGAYCKTIRVHCIAAIYRAFQEVPPVQLVQYTVCVVVIRRRKGYTHKGVWQSVSSAFLVYAVHAGGLKDCSSFENESQRLYCAEAERTSNNGRILRLHTSGRALSQHQLGRPVRPA